ncbi:MAG: glycoside hydrolase family 31 protein [Flavobacterium sp.]|nr:glycoside hydrolase family 31 protein [Flavobacterium sp.]
MKKLLFFILFTYASVAQNPNRIYQSCQWEDNTLKLKVSDGAYEIKIINDKIAETSFIPKGESFNPDSYAIIPVTSNVEAKFTESQKALDIFTPGIKIIIEKSPFKIIYFNRSSEILSEKNGYTKKDSTELIDFNLDNTEALYGGGSRALGMNRRGNRLKLYNRAQYGYGDRADLLNFCMPIILSSKMYMVHFDNAPIGFLDLDSKKDNTLTYETISGRKTYQVIAADSWQDLEENYTTLTGKQPLPPRWAFGNFSSRFGYHTQKEVTETIDKFEKEKIPVDAIILDLYWFGAAIKGTLGNFEFDKDNFPNPEKMISDLKKKGIKTILITEPFVLTTSKKWQEAVDKKILATDITGKPFTYDFYFGNTGLIDIFQPQGKTWFWNIYKHFTEMGVAGWWGDLGEPELHPSKLFHGEKTADEVHNIYGHNWAKLVSEGYKTDFPNQRPFILMRAGFSGSQRFGMIPWSGDVGRSWGGLKSQLEIALQMGMQGMGYMHSDLGGFAGDNVDNELYVRWLQYGVFQPIFRPHAAESVPAEPVYREEKTKQLAKQAIELRYQMLAYNYTIAFDNNQKGTPLMRPLLFEEPLNKNVLGRSDEYFWGDALLVAPVTEAGQKAKEIYFPDTANWYDFYSDTKHDNGVTEKIKLSEDHIPVFVRAGAFLPMVNLVQNTRDYTTQNIELHYYFDENTPKSEGHLYNDDGETPDAYEKGRYELMHFNAKATGEKITINISNEKGEKMIELDRKFTLIIHNITAKPQKTTIDGKKVKSKWDKKCNMLVVNFKYERKKSKTITVQLTK